MYEQQDLGRGDGPSQIMQSDATPQTKVLLLVYSTTQPARKGKDRKKLRAQITKLNQKCGEGDDSTTLLKAFMDQNSQKQKRHLKKEENFKFNPHSDFN